MAFGTAFVRFAGPPLGNADMDDNRMEEDL
jgi:hypothetical protein